MKGNRSALEQVRLTSRSATFEHRRQAVPLLEATPLPQEQPDGIAKRESIRFSK